MYVKKLKYFYKIRGVFMDNLAKQIKELANNLRVDVVNFTVDQLMRLMTANKINIDEIEIDENFASQIAESLLLNIPMQFLIFHEKENTYNVLDGKKRLKSLKYILSHNKIKNVEIAGMINDKQLNQDMIFKILDSKIQVLVVDYRITDEIAEKISKRFK